MFEEIDTSTVCNVEYLHLFKISHCMPYIYIYIYSYISLKDFIYTSERDIEVSMFTVVK